MAAIQLDPDGKSRTTDRKTVTLSGLPLAFRGPDGEPAMLPQSPRVEEAMRRRSANREEEEEMEYEDRDARRDPGVSAVDLYYAAQAGAQQNRGLDPEALDVIRRAQNDANEHMARSVEAQQKLNEQTISAQDRELQRLREQMRVKEETAQAPFNYAMQMMESRGNVEMTNMRAQLDAMRSDHTMQMQMIQSEHSRVVESYQREMDRMREDMRLREDQIRSMVSGQYQGQIAALENRAMMAEQNATRNVDMARQDADRREQQMKLMLESGFDSKFHLISSERDRLQNEINSTRKELAEFRAIAMEVKDPIQQLQQMQALVGAVQGFTGGGGESEAAEKAPEDFMGKIAHYGPGFARHFLSPILQRVDAATNVANEQLQVRQREYDYVTQMNPPQAADPRRLPPAPQPVNVHQPTYHNPAEQGPHIPQPPHEPMAGEGVIPDGMMKLVQFLDEKLETDTPPQEAATELHMGLEMGVIPQEVFTDFVGRPTEEVISDVAAAASVMQLGGPGSPRGVRFAQELLSILRS